MPDTTLTSAELDELEQWVLKTDKPDFCILKRTFVLRLLSLARAGLEAGKAEESMREPQGIRICPERDGPCPHGHGCQFSQGRYRCDIDASRTAIRALPLTGDKP